MKKFDILAIEPMNEKMMNQFCGGQLDCDILCLTMSSRLEVDLKRANLALVSSIKFFLTLMKLFLAACVPKHLPRDQLRRGAS